jgi:transposase-like protein
MGNELRKRRHGTRREAGVSWYVDKTYLKVRGQWVYLYRAIDRDGNLIDAMLSERRDMTAANAFFRSAMATLGFLPNRVTTDGHGSYPRAIRTVLGSRVQHRTNAYFNNRLEQDHRGIKGRIRCMRDFKNHESAERVCREHGELRDLLRPRRRHNQVISAAPASSKVSALRSTSCRPFEGPSSANQRLRLVARELTARVGVRTIATRHGAGGVPYRVPDERSCPWATHRSRWS